MRNKFIIGLLFVPLVSSIVFLIGNSYFPEVHENATNFTAMDISRVAPDLGFFYQYDNIVKINSNPLISIHDYFEYQYGKFLIFHFDIFYQLGSILWRIIFTIFLVLAYKGFQMARNVKQSEITKRIGESKFLITINSIIFSIVYFILVYLISTLMMKVDKAWIIWLSIFIDIILFACSVYFFKNTVHFIGSKLLHMFKMNKEYSDIICIIAGIAVFILLFTSMLLLGLPRIIVYFITTIFVGFGLFGEIYYILSRKEKLTLTASSSD